MALARGRGLLRWAFHSAWKLPPSWGPFLSFSEPFTAGMWALEHNLHQGGDPCFCFVLMWSIFKVFLNLLQYCFCFMFWFSGHEACGILAPKPGIKPILPVWKGKISCTGPLGKSLGVLALSTLCLLCPCFIPVTEISLLHCLSIG